MEKQRISPDAGNRILLGEQQPVELFESVMGWLAGLEPGGTPVLELVLSCLAVAECLVVQEAVGRG